MRYDDWDVLLFPSGRDARIPFKEFKVNCHVVSDNEFAHNRSAFGIPVMTCFVPSLQAGAQFHISIHCWGTPQLSQYALTYSKHPELVRFEARILIDGRMVASTSFEPLGQWPHLITNTCEITKQGELEPLTFPSFRRELLYQNHWNPGDNIGRIKIIISEGFPRDSPSNPIERVKNVAAFSFQHAPLGKFIETTTSYQGLSILGYTNMGADILESNGIAWPNPQMWRRPQNNAAMPVPTYHPDDGGDSHLHSPRRRHYIGHAAAGSSSGLVPNITHSLMTQSAGALDHTHLNHDTPVGQKSASSSGSSVMDPFSEAAYQEWVNSLGFHQQQTAVESKAVWPTSTVGQGTKRFAVDSSMPSIPDYFSPNLVHNMVTEHMDLSGPSLDEDGQIGNPKVPANTPTTLLNEGNSSTGPFQYDIPNPAVSSELATSLTHSLLNQPHPMHNTTAQLIQPHQIPLPASEVRSRKENRHLTNAGSMHSPSSNPSPSIEAQIRKFSQSSNLFSFIGTDRSDSSASGPSYSRCNSAGEFGGNLTNQMTPSQTYTGVAASGNAPGSGSEKGTKRGRNFTPASARVIDDEDEPRRASPKMRVASALSLDIDGEA